MPLETVNMFDKAGNDDFKPTEEEIRTIADKMKNPEFAKLMHEYMQTLSDPETRKEEEAYLKQMEEEAKAGGDYSFDFIFPKPGFVVELKQTYGYKKNIAVYVNVCDSERVDEFREETTGNRMGSNWHVPVAVSQEREEDFEGKKVAVYDAVFHPKTRTLADRSDRFLCFLVEIAVEHINAGYKQTFGFEFTRLSSSIQSIGTPKNQTVRKEKGKSAFPLSNEPVSTKPIKPTFEATTKYSNQDAKKAPTPTPTPTPVQTVAAPKPDVSSLPKYTVLHEGSIEIQDAWQWKIVDKRVGVPQRLVVRMEFPGVSSAAHLDIDVLGAYIELHKSDKHKFHGSILLPFTVEEIPVAAKFDKSKQLLSLTLKVVPPQRPADAITAEDMMQAQRQPVKEDEQPSEVTLVESLPKAVAPSITPSVQDTPLVEETQVQETQVALTPSSAPVVTSPAVVEPEAPPVVATQREESAPTHIAPDRATQLMAKLQEARREREAAEEAERVAKQESAVTSTSSTTPLAEETPEVIDLRKKQDAWMSSMRKEQEAKDRARQEEEDEAQRKADEELRKQQRDARKKLDAEREAERQEEALQKKVAELPLKSRFIFAID